MNRLTGMIAAASLAISAATPSAAQTDEELLRNIITGAAILGIGAAIIDNRKDRKREAARREAEVSRDGGDAYGRSGVWSHRDDDRRIIEGEVTSQWMRGPKPGRGYKKDPLPARCRVTVETPQGERPGYSSQCLDARYKQARHLPGQCEVLVRTSNGLRAVYGERCLDRDGWQTPRGH